MKLKSGSGAPTTVADGPFVLKKVGGFVAGVTGELSVAFATHESAGVIVVSPLEVATTADWLLPPNWPSVPPKETLTVIGTVVTFVKESSQRAQFAVRSMWIERLIETPPRSTGSVVEKSP